MARICDVCRTALPLVERRGFNEPQSRYQKVEKVTRNAVDFTVMFQIEQAGHDQPDLCGECYWVVVKDACENYKHGTFVIEV